MKAIFLFSTLLVVAHHQVWECFAKHYETHDVEGDTSLTNKPYDDSDRNENSTVLESKTRGAPLYRSKHTSRKGRKSSSKFPESTVNRTLSLDDGRHVLYKNHSKSNGKKSPSSNGRADEKKVFRVKKTVEILIDAPTRRGKRSADAVGKLSKKSDGVEVPDTSRSDVEVTSGVPTNVTMEKSPVHSDEVVTKSTYPETGVDNGTVDHRLPEDTTRIEEGKPDMTRESTDDDISSNGAKEMDYADTPNKKSELTLEDPGTDSSATFESPSLHTKDGDDSLKGFDRSPLESPSDTNVSIAPGMVVPHHRSSHPLHTRDDVRGDDGDDRPTTPAEYDEPRVRNDHGHGEFNEPSNHRAHARPEHDTYKRSVHKGEVEAHHGKRGTKKYYNELGDEYVADRRTEFEEKSDRRMKTAHRDLTGDAIADVTDRTGEPDSTYVDVAADEVKDDDSNTGMTNEDSGFPFYPQMIEKEAIIDDTDKSADFDEDTMSNEDDSGDTETDDSTEMNSGISTPASETVDDNESTEVSDGSSLRGLRSKGRKGSKKNTKLETSKMSKKSKKKAVNKRKSADKKAKRNKRLERKRMTRAARKRSKKDAKQAKIAAKKSLKEAKKEAKDAIKKESKMPEGVNLILPVSETPAPKSMTNSSNDDITGKDEKSSWTPVNSLGAGAEKADSAEGDSEVAGKGPGDCATSDDAVAPKDSSATSISSVDGKTVGVDDTAEGTMAEKDSTPAVEDSNVDEGDEAHTNDSEEALGDETAAEETAEDNGVEITHL
ncbi:E3 ubiquitin-ligase RNF213, putative [Babesia ovata]|uniref:E3 ubiquitin-ligase RNF213, putative n=1 Tax=Babesia ovata TaxID=189622 RepID=A0A2H6KH93_9APIC|nr:E3 ubiquitin-ligase RNF213, putative [Babesia ovata]GBE62367.1 E3 ubiquitin-ligase RNF213, putative [Babesia ovata]